MRGLASVLAAVMVLHSSLRITITFHPEGAQMNNSSRLPAAFQRAVRLQR